MITELLQQPGSFEITLKEDTPLLVRESIPYSVAGVPFGHICVTPQRLPPQVFTRAQILSVAYWTGRIQGRSNRMRTYSGHGLAVWLGDADNKCNRTSGGGGAAASMTTIVTAILATDGNGITIGSTAADTGTLKTTVFLNEVPIDIINQFADSTNNAWRINPDGTLDLGAPATLFRGTPTVVLMNGEGGTDINLSALYCPDLDVAEDFDDYADDIFVTGQSAATGASNAATAGFTAPKDFGGTNDADIRIEINADTSTNAQCITTGTSYLTLHKTSRRTVSGNIQDVYDPRHYMAPGDQVYVYEPECGLIDLTVSVPILGRYINPASALLRGITWPVAEGMGVYTIQTQDGSNTVVDLTDWIEWETGGTRLELGALRRPAAQPATPNFGSRTA